MLVNKASIRCYQLGHNNQLFHFILFKAVKIFFIVFSPGNVFANLKRTCNSRIRNFLSLYYIFMSVCLSVCLSVCISDHPSFCVFFLSFRQLLEPFGFFIFLFIFYSSLSLSLSPFLTFQFFSLLKHFIDRIQTFCSEQNFQL